MEREWGGERKKKKERVEGERGKRDRESEKGEGEVRKGEIIWKERGSDLRKIFFVDSLGSM